jgi:hypothetical protein
LLAAALRPCPDSAGWGLLLRRNVVRETDYIVIRPAADLPPGFLPPHQDGRWYDRASLPPGPPPGSASPPGITVSEAVAVPTGRFEVRDYDGAVAEVWEVRP